jgi:mannose-6-phosphate isomerase-like protein (cupin superfamily)
MEKVNLTEKFQRVGEYWSPRIVAAVNDSFVKIAKLQGEFTWHKHDREDELFLVVSGTLRIRFRDGETLLKSGELCVVPRGVEHMPVAEEEVHVLLLEPKTTVNTGDERTERTVDPEWV